MDNSRESGRAMRGVRTAAHLVLALAMLTIGVRAESTEPLGHDWNCGSDNLIFHYYSPGHFVGFLHLSNGRSLVESFTEMNGQWQLQMKSGSKNVFDGSGAEKHQGVWEFTSPD